ncbi:MAG: MBL fold metallo-hydrolase [Bacteroidaceae bacterium]|jgi:glyoxylase-like metal-dependent hydrolase (beta-lactamase superfamily II)|nr:MBL fold metallo-hydrolase [Bacteroidaceae bacterium]
MNIKTFIVNPLGVNCYLVHDDTKEGVIIDCGCSTEGEWKEIKDYIDSENLTIKHLLNTHLHFDHVWGNSFAFRDLKLSPEAHRADAFIYQDMDRQIERVVGFRIPHPPMPELGCSLKEGDTISFGSTSLKVLHTPGHSQGSLCFYAAADEVLFSGDTLFYGSCGRTDLEGGSHSDIMKSLQRLALLPESTKVMCGHGPSTTIKTEKCHNPYM